MPTYRITAPDGRTVRLTGDAPPTDQELEEIFANLPAKAPEHASEPRSGDGIRRANLLPIAGEEEVLGTVARLPKELLRETSGYLPAAGGIAGAVLGSGWGSVPGAALGASAGESGRRLIDEAILADEAPTGGLQAAQDIATTGAVSGATQALGLGLAKGAAAGVGKVADSAAGRFVQGAGKKFLTNTTTGKVLKAGWDNMTKAEQQALQARVGHAIARAEKEAAEEAPRVVQMAPRTSQTALQPLQAVETPQITFQGPRIAPTASAAPVEATGEVLEAGTKAGKVSARVPKRSIPTDAEANAARMAQRQAFIDSSTLEQTQYLADRALKLREAGMSAAQIGEQLASETGLPKATATKAATWILKAKR